MKQDFSKLFTPILEASMREVNRLGSVAIQPEHFMLVAVSDTNGYGYKILSHMQIPLDKIRKELERYLSSDAQPGETTTLFEQQYRISLGAVRHLQLATSEARKMNGGVIGSEHIIMALIHDPRSMDSEILRKIKDEYLHFDISIQAIGDISPMGMGQNNPVDNDDDEEDAPVSPKNSSRQQSNGKGKQNSDTPALDKFGYDMTKAAAEGRLDPVVGREREIERLAQILSRRKKNNPVLIGEPGVGKSAIVEGLALRINQHLVPRVLLNKRVVSLDMAGIVAGTKYRGQFEERIKAVLDELSHNDNIILFIDEIHTIVGAGSAPGSMDAANMLKPALARGEIQCIGATTLDEYRHNIEKDGALERRFQKVIVEPTSPEETLAILRQVKDKYEKHHNVTYTDQALEACVSLTERYVSDRNFPDKALDALDEAGSRVHITNIIVPEEIDSMEKEVDRLTVAKLEAAKSQDYEKAANLLDEETKARERLEKAKTEWENGLSSNPQIVDDEKVAEVVALMTGVPTQRIAQTEGTRLLEMGERLKGSVIGQDDAVAKVVKAIQRNRIGLKDPDKPIGVFMFLGPTGVGKTLLAKKMAEYLFDSPDALIRVDMSEFMEKFTVSRLVGAPPGYVGYEEGGQLTEAVRRKPYSVVLFDEIEKAHPDVFNVLLQVLDDGRITDSQGRTVDFKNTILIMTSNIGSSYLLEGIDENGNIREEAQTLVMNDLRAHFRPEFLNRLDETILFKPLGRDDIASIINLLLDELNERLKDRELALTLTEQAKAFITEHGYDPVYGARPLKRYMQKHVETLAAKLILGGEAAAGDTIVIDTDGEELTASLQSNTL